MWEQIRSSAQKDSCNSFWRCRRMSSHLCSHAGPDITHCIVMDWQRSAGIFADVSFFSQYVMATWFDGDIIDGMTWSSNNVLLLCTLGYEIWSSEEAPRSWFQLPILFYDSHTKTKGRASLLWNTSFSYEIEVYILICNLSMKMYETIPLIYEIYPRPICPHNLHVHIVSMPPPNHQQSDFHPVDWEESIHWIQ